MGEESLQDPARCEKPQCAQDHQGLPGETFDFHPADSSGTPAVEDVNLLGRGAQPDTAAEQPAMFGRYEVVGVLGSGGFGVVYRGFDPELRREVAIKVPCAVDVSKPADTDAYLAEARVLASLNHPGIVPVYDFGRTDDGLCYVVSRFQPGGDLAKMIANGRPLREKSAELTIHIAEALHHAHTHGLVHRDIKPGNILLDEQGHALVADFGLALTDELYGREAGVLGTVEYMSPEQARGEGHLVDARSDIYSLGVVFYELLTGRRPYRQKDTPQLLREIASGEIRPPRQLDHTIPEELERICLKAMAKRSADRYTTAFDLAEDLRHWQSDHQTRQIQLLPLPSAGQPDGSALAPNKGLPAFSRVISRWVIITAVVAAVAAVGWGGLAALDGNSAPTKKHQATVQPELADSLGTALDHDTPSPAAADSTLPLQVRSIDVQHYGRLNEREAEPQGILGKQSFAPRLGDQVTIEARLSRPAYAYLIAFRPDGGVEVCFPEDESQPPPLSDRPRYPSPAQPDRRYGLREGVGLWVFAVVASDQQLPAYGEFVSEHKPAWGPDGKAPTAVWWYDGQIARPLTGKRGGTLRGKGELALGAPAELVHLANSLRTNSSQIIAAIGFGVGDK